MTLPNEAPQLPFNRDAALAIEQAIVALRDIVSRAPGVLTFFACEAFITHELAPALEALRSASGHRAAEKCAELIALFKEYIYRRSYSGNWWNDRYSFDTMQKVEKIERAAALPETPQPATQRSEPDAAALRYLFDSTASDGQWADQAVHNFVGAMLKQAPQ
ncbi:MAG: hypothetical protein U0990_12565, partial [Candidatus Nanopelagicales bacterium]|nr:hypothetical protein [Candidatus Nanopelagicales bacterium]